MLKGMTEAAPGHRYGTGRRCGRGVPDPALPGGRRPRPARAPAPPWPGRTAHSRTCAPLEDPRVQGRTQDPANERDPRQVLNVLQGDAFAAAAGQHERRQVRRLLHAATLAAAGVALQLRRPAPRRPPPRVGDGSGGPLLHRVHLPPTPSPQLLHIRELVPRQLSSAPPAFRPASRPLAGAVAARRHAPCHAPSRGTPGTAVPTGRVCSAGAEELREDPSLTLVGRCSTT
jgi:hypothetical protein